MFQTITGKPFCPIAAIASPEGFSAGLSCKRKPRPSVWCVKGGARAGSREPSQRVLGGLPPGKHPGRGECSSRNVRHKITAGRSVRRDRNRAACAFRASDRALIELLRRPNTQVIERLG